MKLAVTSTGPTLDDQVETRFGRCSYFLIVDSDSMQFEAVENPNVALGGGAGIQSAQKMTERGVSHVLTGHCGPNAFTVLGRAGVEVVVGVVGSVRDAVEQFRAGEFASAAAPNVQSHFGMGAGGQTGQALDAGLDESRAPIPGMRLGRGSGLGGGREFGGDRGVGRGRGMWEGRGTGFGMAWNPWMGPGGFGGMHGGGESFHINQRVSAPVDERTDRSARREYQEATRTGLLRGSRKAAALVRARECAGCGACLDVCPVRAIRIERQAVVNPVSCTACGACVSKCPNGAIIIVQQRV